MQTRHYLKRYRFKLTSCRFNLVRDRTKIELQADIEIQHESKYDKIDILYNNNNKKRFNLHMNHAWSFFKLERKYALQIYKFEKQYASDNSEVQYIQHDLHNKYTQAYSDLCMKQQKINNEIKDY